jgi:glutamate racemase
MGPIGVFDSGLGGLTVVQALGEALPGERLVYFGDTARLPYGTKAEETVVRYSQRSARFLLGHDIKMLLVACNTASAFALESLQREAPVPVLGAVEPGADEAVAATRTGRVGVIGTLGTVRSGSYVRAIAARAPAVKVTPLACPLFVPLVEEGWLGEQQARLENVAALAVTGQYLDLLYQRDPELDVIVLGCTHYPLLRPLLERVAATLWRHPVTFVDSAQAMARAAARELAARGLLTDGAAASPPPPQRLSCYVTDEARFPELAARFLGHPLAHVEKVDLP